MDTFGDGEKICSGLTLIIADNLIYPEWSSTLGYVQFRPDELWPLTLAVQSQFFVVRFGLETNLPSALQVCQMF